MATMYDLKPKFQNLLRPVANWAAKKGITPNQVTGLALLLSLGGGLTLAFHADTPLVFAALPIILFLRMGLNAIDGLMAREHHMATHKGALFNELSDVISDTALYLPFALVPGFSPILVMCILYLSVLTELAGILSVQIGASRRYDGPMGKSDRALVFGALGCALAVGVYPFPWANELMIFLLLLLGETVWKRLKRGVKEARHA